MAIRICPECGKKVTDKRKDCPHCNYQFPETKMCPECGEEVDLNLLECPECGYVFESLNTEEVNENVTNNSTASINDCGLGISSSNKQLFKFNRTITKDEFLRLVLIELTKNEKSPSNILSAKFGEVEESEVTGYLVRCVANGSYTGTVGYDREEEYFEQEYCHVGDGMHYTLNGIPKVGTGDFVYKDVKKTRIVTDWRPHSGFITNQSFLHGFMDEEYITYKFSLSALLAKDGLSKLFEVMDDYDEIESEYINKGKKLLYSRVVDSIFWPGDHAKEKVHDISLSDYDIIRIIIPTYKVNYEYDGITYTIEGFAIDGIKPLLNFIPSSSNVNSVERIKIVEELKIEKKKIMYTISKIIVALSFVCAFIGFIMLVSGSSGTTFFYIFLGGLAFSIILAIYAAICISSIKSYHKKQKDILSYLKYVLLVNELKNRNYEPLTDDEIYSMDSFLTDYDSSILVKYPNIGELSENEAKAWEEIGADEIYYRDKIGDTTKSKKRIKKILGNYGVLSGKHKRKQIKNKKKIDKKKLLIIILILIGTSALSTGGYFGVKEIIKHNELGEMLVISENEESIEIVDFNDSIAEKYNITEITIPKEVTSIGEYAFEDRNLVKIKFEENSQLTNIGGAAFMNCSSLESIVIPNSVTSIGDCAFKGCSSLKLVAFEENSQLTSIGGAAFMNCSSLESIAIPNSVISIGYSAFERCSSLKAVAFEENSQLTSIGNYAFCFCSSLESIAIPNSVTSIGDCALFNCFSLESIVIPNSVTSIGDSAFGIEEHGNITTLEKVYYKGTIEDWCNIEFTDFHSNPMCYADHFYMLDENKEWYELTEIIIPSTVTSIGEYQFSGFVNVTSIYIPNSVTSIGYAAFYDCNSLESITIPFVGQYADGSGKAHFGYIFGARSYDYYGNVPSSLKEVIITGGTSIKSKAFYKCENLITITIPNSIISISLDAFDLCDNLNKIYFNGNLNEWIKIENATSIFDFDEVYLLNDSGDYEVHEHVFTFDIVEPTCTEKGYTICTCVCGYSYEKDIVPELGHDIDHGNCSRCSYSYVKYKLSSDGQSYIVTGCNSNAREIVVLSEYKGLPVSQIDSYAFSDCKSLTNLVIPNSVKIIKWVAFKGCDALESITLPFVGFYADDYPDINFMNVYTSLEESFGFGLVPSSLKEVIITDDKTLGSDAFRNCSSIESIVIPNSVTYIGDGAFSYCSSLENIYYKGTIEDWCDIKFTDSYSNPMCYAEHFYMLNENKEWYEATEIIIPNTVTSIGNYQFYGFNNVTKFIIPNSVTSIGEYAFRYCSSLESIVIPNSVTSIGEYAFFCCSSLEKIVIPNSLESIGYRAFFGCDSLTIYCEAASKPNGWDDDWNYSSRPVYWAGQWEYDSNGNPVTLI